MRSAGNPMELLIAVVAAGFLLELIGDGPFMVLVWIAVGLYALVVLTPMIAGMFKGLGRVAERVERASAAFALAKDGKDDPYLQAHQAMGLQDMDKLRHLVEQEGVDPFAPFPSNIERPMLAETLYAYAKGTNYRAAIDYFDSVR